MAWLQRRRRDIGLFRDSESVDTHGLADDFRKALIHAGVVATTSDGQRYLLEKGINYGSFWNTKASCTSDQDGKWTKRLGPKIVSGNKTIGNYIQSGGKNYKLFKDNCLHAAIRMYDLS